MKALLIINLQNDFMPWGTVPIEGSDELAPKINQIMDQFDEVIAIQSWYPADHSRFAANHIWRKPGQTIEIDGNPVLLWIMHCVRNSFGAELVSDLNTEKIHRVFKKGKNKTNTTYSAFDHPENGLYKFLKEKKVNEISIAGLSEEFDIKDTAREAESKGFITTVLKELCGSFKKRKSKLKNNKRSESEDPNPLSF